MAGYRLNNQGSISGENSNSSVCTMFQTSKKVQVQYEHDHLLPSSTNLKNNCTFTYIPHICFYGF